MPGILGDKMSPRVDLLQIQDSLRRIERACSDTPTSNGIFGRYSPLPALSLSQMGEIEEALGITLPDEYRDFLANIANGGALGACHLFPIQDAINGFINEPFPVDPKTYISEDDGYDFSEGACFHGAIGLTDFGCGSFAVLVLVGNERGMVWEFHGADDVLWHTYKESFFEWLERQFQFALHNCELRLSKAPKK